ncbi:MULTISPECIES: glycosyltransferase family 2 protein [unclassified Nostoc]|uniref:glycosyltransferase family 2 protein n=1 Tax=unclassified Nostoc TaxID=2593658 RepID=UPI001D60A228|nr:glycosyltransferase [Nostoc sp. JL23]MBN3878585.1 glycosyltransferase [Nostoc sp. JL23]
MPKISVIIPAYNAERTIAETIQSVQKQSFLDFELIVINDGSKDRTVEIVQSIKDERLQIFSYENGGLPVARNRGISHATGEFIAFLDADDLWTADKLERQLMALEQNPEAGVAYSWTCFMDVDEQGKPLSFLPSPRYAFAGNVYEKLLVSDFIHNGSNTLIRRQTLESTGGFDPACPGCADWDYWLRLSTRWYFVVIPKHQILYRRTPGAMSSNIEKMKEDALIAMKKAYQAAPPELQYLKKYTIVNFHIYFAGLYLQHRSHSSGVRQAQQHIWSAIRLNPKVLLDKTTQKLVIKLLLKLILPTKVANYLLQLMKKPLTLSDPRLEA